MLFQIIAYFRFLFRSTNEHGVHSPFVFELVTKCFNDRKIHPEYKIMDSFRQTLFNNDLIIAVTDFGAGSKVFKSNDRKISDIAKNAGITKQRARLLFRMVKYFKPESILEIGTSVGLATGAMSLGMPDCKIVTLEGCTETAKAAKIAFEKYGLSNIESVNTKFEDYFSNIGAKKFDLIYFDGNHTKAATINYFKMLLPTVLNNTVWIFDDIHWSSEMEEAWELIKQRQEVRITIDTYQWGIIFFRKEQEKEDFTIRVD